MRPLKTLNKEEIRKIRERLWGLDFVDREVMGILFQYPKQIVEKWADTVISNPPEVARELVESLKHPLQKIPGTNNFEKWRKSLDSDHVRSVNERIRYRKLDEEIEERVIETVLLNPQRNKEFYINQKLDEMVFDAYSRDFDITGKLVYPFSGWGALPHYITRNFDDIVYIDVDFSPENIRNADKVHSFKENKIKPVKHDLHLGLPRKAKKVMVKSRGESLPVYVGDVLRSSARQKGKEAGKKEFIGENEIGLTVLKACSTMAFKKMHKDLEKCMKPGSLVACHLELSDTLFPIEERYGKFNGRTYSVMPPWIYTLHGGKKGLGGYTVPLDYSLSKESKDAISKTTGKRVRNLSDLTPLYFLEVVK